MKFSRLKMLFPMNRRSVFISSILSYMLILLLPIAVGAIIYLRFIGILEDKTIKYNLAMLQQLNQSVDSRLQEIDHLNLQISFNPQLQLLLNGTEKIENLRGYQFISFMKDLQRYRNISSFITDYYVYFPAEDVVITPSLKTDAHTFYYKIYPYRSVSFEAWRDEMMGSYHYEYFYPSAEMSMNANKMLTYVQSLPYGEQNNLKGALVILIEDRKIMDLLKVIEPINKSSIYIVNSDNQVIMSTAESRELPAPLLARLAGKEDSFDYKINGEKMTVSYTSSQHSGWKFISILSKQVYLEQVNLIKVWVIALFSFCLLGGVLAAWFMAFRTYKPIREIVHTLKAKQSAEPHRMFNEFIFIKEAIRDSLIQQETLEETIVQQAPVIKANFLSRLIRGLVDYASLDDKTLELVNLKLISDYFAVMLIDIDDIRSSDEAQSEHKWILIRFVISNVCKDLKHDQDNAFFVEMYKSKLAILINVGIARFNAGEADLKAEYKYLVELLSHKFGTDITVAISSIHKGLDKIQECYREALEASDYKLLIGTGQIIGYEEIADKSDKSTYYYPVDLEIQLTNMTKSSDIAGVENVLDHIYEINFITRQLTPELGKCLFFNFISTELKIINAAGFLYEDIFPDGPGPMRQLEDCNNAWDMHQKMKGFFVAICEYFRLNRSGNSQLISSITGYINANYNDDLLSLASVAEKFGITPQYLSGLFKKQMNQNFSDYIAVCRVEKAKAMLSNPALTISYIAKEVGYHNDTTLIRVFKKYVGVSPSKYRNQ